MVRFSLAAAALVSASLASAQSTTPTPVAAPAVRIVAVGDLHGDFAAWTAIAKGAGLIDAKGHWAGGKTILVQTGDVVDRGPDSIDILRQLQSLQREAARVGGKVVALIGNHEAMNMTGDLRYVSAGEFAGFVDARSSARRERYYGDHRATLEADAHLKDPSLSPLAIHDAWIKATPLGLVEHGEAWKPDGSIGKWVIANDAVALIGSTLFLHGGISPKFASLRPAEINRRVKAALAVQDTTDTAIINDSLGPLWYRGLIVPGDPAKGVAALSADQQVTLALKAQGAARIVVGHTPIISGISIRSGGRLIDIDTGISVAYGGKLSYLEIVGDKVSAHEVPRPAPIGGGK